MGLMIVFAGVFLILMGLVFLFAGKIPWLGHLPGDVQLRGKGWSFSFPLVTCIVVSLILSLILSVIFRWMNK
jgi:uncharacterized membrane-anchored protein